MIVICGSCHGGDHMCGPPCECFRCEVQRAQRMDRDRKLLKETDRLVDLVEHDNLHDRPVDHDTMEAIHRVARLVGCSVGWLDRYRGDEIHATLMFIQLALLPSGDEKEGPDLDDQPVAHWLGLRSRKPKLDGGIPGL